MECVILTLSNDGPIDAHALYVMLAAVGDANSLFILSGADV